MCLESVDTVALVVSKAFKCVREGEDNLTSPGDPFYHSPVYDHARFRVGATTVADYQQKGETIRAESGEWYPVGIHCWPNIEDAIADRVPHPHEVILECDVEDIVASGLQRVSSVTPLSRPCVVARRVTPIRVMPAG